MILIPAFFVSLAFVSFGVSNNLNTTRIVGVLRAEADKQFHGLRKNGECVPWAVRDIGHRHSVLTDRDPLSRLWTRGKEPFVIARRLRRCSGV